MLLVENLPFNVAGWNDKSRTFYPSVGGLCSHVDHVRMPDYSKFGKKTSHGSLDPDMTLADAAEAIPNGAKETWLDILRRLMCFPLHITACNLFSTKWVEICNTVGVEEEVSIAVKHFKDQWLQERLRYW